MKFTFKSVAGLLVLNLATVACSTETVPTSNTSAAASVPKAEATQTATQTATVAMPEMTVYKSATCGCCKDWIAYVETAGFSVSAIDVDNLDTVKDKHGLANPALKSCHTAIVDGYVIEGHVPLSDIERLLAERPDVVGLTAPGMPMMSPGMGSEIPKDYDVLAFDKNGQSSIYTSY